MGVRVEAAGAAVDRVAGRFDARGIRRAAGGCGAGRPANAATYRVVRRGR